MSDFENLLQNKIQPNAEALKANLLRKGTPDRVYFMELYEDKEIKDEICRIYGIGSDLDPADEHFGKKREIAIQRFLGYDAVGSGLENFTFETRSNDADDTVEGTQSRGQRHWAEEHAGPIQNWDDFEAYPWPDPSRCSTASLEWYAENLPDDMCIYAGCHSVFENVTWLMGYESLCYAIFDQPDLVDALFEKIGGIFYEAAKILVQMPRVDILFGGDDMGFKTGTMVQADVLRDKSLVWHKKMAALAHEHDKVYMLHACGNLKDIMEDLIEDVKLDAKHSFEDTIEPLPLAKKRWGDRLGLVGGIDVDLLTRGSEEQIRQRVREVVDACQPGGGFCLGSGNTVANYVPVKNYLVMLDEARKMY